MGRASTRTSRPTPALALRRAPHLLGLTRLVSRAHAGTAALAGRLALLAYMSDRLCLLHLPPADACHVTLLTYLWNMKHLMQHMFDTAKTFGTYIYNICVKRMQHLDKTHATYLWNRWNFFILQPMQYLDVFLQHPDKQIAIFVWNSWNTWSI
jgi:hypothetical protein